MKGTDLGLFTLFLVVNLIGSSVNHIDDTDETYGYWEPLHYLLYGVGMQTWEYAPAYAIRTYAFIYPISFIGEVLKALKIPKHLIFHAIKGLLGTAAAHAQARFITTLSNAVDQSAASNAAVFLLLAPGVFFASTAYLPSAVCMTVLMLSTAAWLENRFLHSVAWGGVAVLCTGWPFVGLLFVPLGLHMVAHSYASVIASKGTHWSAIKRVLQLALSVVIIVTVMQVLVFLMDYRYYGKWTSPTLNILLYNAIGGSGDELYGVEPASYYVKNLFLNMGIAWPLALLSPAVYLVSSVLQRGKGGGATVDARVRGAVLHVQAAIWLGVLFSRPHKEERFMYPIYPLIAYIAGNTLDHTLRILTNLFGSAATTVPAVTGQHLQKGKKAGAPSGAARERAGAAWVGPAKSAILAGCVLGSLALFTARVVSNSANYGGYITLWKRAGQYIAERRALTSTASPVEALRQGQGQGGGPSVNVCTGGEWYQFPSHFFLPAGTRVQYIRDGFGGILPQHFATVNGTAGEPLQAFNDRNAEVTSRYVAPSDCDYLVLLVDTAQHEGGQGQGNDLRARLRQGTELAEEAELEGQRFRRVLSEKVISSAASSGSGLYRAFYVPFRSSHAVRMQDYVLYEQVKE